MEQVFIRINSHRSRRKVEGALSAGGFGKLECFFNFNAGYAYRVPAEAFKALREAPRKIPGVTRAREQSADFWAPCWHSGVNV